MTFRMTIKGVEIDTPWNVGQTAIQAATEAVARINAKTNLLPVTASNGGGTLAVVSRRGEGTTVTLEVPR